MKHTVEFSITLSDADERTLADVARVEGTTPDKLLASVVAGPPEKVAAGLADFFAKLRAVGAK